MLSLPLLAAVASAGLVGGVHCLGMCGPFAHLLGAPAPALSSTAQAASAARVIMLQPAAVAVQSGYWRRQLALHGGRLSLYAMLGALAGALGAGGMALSPILPLQKALFILGNLGLILLGLHLLQWQRYWPHSWHRAWSRMRGGVVARRGWLSFSAGARQMLAHGQRHPFLLGLAWGCLPCGLLYAVLPFALLSGAPGSGAVLMLVFGLCSLPHLMLAGIARQLRHPAWQISLAVLLLGLGLFGLSHADMRDMPAWLCVSVNQA